MRNRYIAVKCNNCGVTSNVLSKGGRDELIKFVCPNCGKYELLVAYDVNLGVANHPLDDKQTK